MDQFYTKDNIASELYNIFKTQIDINKFDLILEPSAGKGAFFKLLPENKRIGLDLEPKFPKIIKQDYLTYQPIKNKTYITIGNPLFLV